MLEILDTTLRDGAQNTGINFSVLDKRDVIKALDAFGIAFIEAGAPGFNAKDSELLSEKIHSSANIAAFGSTRKKNLTAKTDDSFLKLLNTPVNTVVIFGKASASHIKSVLCTTLDENLNMIVDSVATATEFGKNVIYDAEHFFDGYRENPEYALRTLKAAAKGGASRIVLCDTNGGSLPEFIATTTEIVVRSLPGIIIGIHCHNDNGLAVANTLAAIDAGATHVQGTLIGFGERCGNANLSTLLPILILSKKLAVDPVPNLSRLTDTATSIADAANVQIPDNMPFIGRAAFAHKAGMHADGVLKYSETFEHISPDNVGNRRKLVLSGEAGTHLIAYKLAPFFPDIEKNTVKLKAIIKKLKELESEGYTFEGAEGSFVILANSILSPKEPKFIVTGYSLETHSETEECIITVQIKVKNKTETVTAPGVGPVHALDSAMRNCLVKYYPELNDVSLIDYKVRVINPKSATGATVRVLISTSDGRSVWRTVGVNRDIIRASFNALNDSYNYALENFQKV